jgi:hypothetical protein
LTSTPSTHDTKIHRRRDFDFNSDRSRYPMPMKPKGLYANIHAKQERIKKGSGEKMRKVGSKGAPTAKAFRDSKKTAKKK